MKEIRFSFDDDFDDKPEEKNSINSEYPETDDIQDDLDFFEGMDIYTKEEKSEEAENTENTEIAESANMDEEPPLNDEEMPEEYDEPEEEINHVRCRRGRPGKRAALGIIIMAAVAVVVCASPVFAVKNIEMSELSYFTKDEICSKINLSVGDNGLFFSKRKAEKALEKEQYIESANVYFKMPDTMVIDIDENKIYCYIPYLGNYLYVNRDGRVIDIKSEIEENVPVVEGLKFSSFKQGEIISVENEKAFETALIISGVMSKYDIEEKALRINVSDCEDIYAYIGSVKVLLGDTTRMDEKIKTMFEAVSEIPEGDKGTLNLQDLDNPIIFKYST